MNSLVKNVKVKEQILAKKNKSNEYFGVFTILLYVNDRIYSKKDSKPPQSCFVFLSGIIFLSRLSF